MADAVQWTLYSGIKNGLHYLHNFILVAENIYTQKDTLLSILGKLSIHIEISKLELEGPSSYLTFLGIEVDTVSLQRWLPKHKLVNLKEFPNGSVLLRTISKKDLQRLTGLLQFATKVVCPGRLFLWSQRMTLVAIQTTL